MDNLLYLHESTKLMKSFYPILLLSFIAFACEPEFSAEENAGSVAIVYGILDKTNTEHHIKITKSFSGGANAYVSAQNPDSSRITGIDPVINVYDGNELISTLDLETKVVSGKEEGTFYGGDQEVYFFTAPLNDNFEYELSFDFEGKRVEARTPVLGKTSWSHPNAQKQKINLVQIGTETLLEPKMTGETIRFTSAENSGIYESYVQIPIIKHYADGSQVNDVINYRTTRTRVDNANETKNGDFDTETLVSTLSNFLDLDENITHREIVGTITFEIVGGAEEFDTYLAVTSPSTGIVQERPSFTNVTNGLGLFSSGVSESREFPLALETIRFFSHYVEVIPFNFCSKDPNFGDEPQVKCP